MEKNDNVPEKTGKEDFEKLWDQRRVEETMAYAMENREEYLTLIGSEEENEFSLMQDGVLGKKQGEFTVEDYLKLPDDWRVELIKGVLYDMASPTSDHQDVAGFLYAEFRNYIKSNGGMCKPYIAPLDVQLLCDDTTMVQPDVMVICDRDKITKKRIFGAPDLAVEVVSPSSRVKDCIDKCDIYREAGVREYWLIYPQKKQVLVYDFEKDLPPKGYTFEEEVPVAIWNGECRIDFREIEEL